MADLATLTVAKGAGTYSGAYTIAMPPGAMAMYRTVKVDVTLDAGHNVNAIAITSPTELDNADFGSKISGSVIAQQSLAADSVSGASYSSKAFLKAVENALSK